MSETTFVPDGDRLIPQPRAAGPWFPGVQHGGAITGLIARAIEAVPSAEPMFVTRMSFDMSRKVPLGPTRVEAETVRDGRRVQSIECRYIVDHDVVARATATRIRIDETVMAAGDGVIEGTTDAPPAGPDEVPEMEYVRDRVDFVHNFSFRRQQTAAGESISWLRLDAEFVAGETASPLQRLAMTADMIPSAGALFDFEKYLSVNPDLSVTIHRLPTGQWIGQQSVVRTSRHGTGQTDGQLFDERGSLGRSIKSLLIDKR